MLAQPRICLIRAEIDTHTPLRGAEELAVPKSFKEIPGGDDDNETQEGPEHATKDHET
jgi:hypothetical protein